MTNTRIIVTHYGGPDALMVIEEEGLEPKPGQVRVRVLAAGVSLPDVRRAREHPSRRPGHFFLRSLPAHAGMADIPHPFFLRLAGALAFRSPRVERGVGQFHAVATALLGAI